MKLKGIDGGALRLPKSFYERPLTPEEAQFATDHINIVFQFNVNYATSNSNSNLGTHQMFDPSFLMFRNDVTAPAPGNRTGPGL